MKDINKDIENLEEIINLINKELDKKDKNVSAILDLKDLLSLRNLIKEYKELEERNSLLIQKNIAYKRNIDDLKHNNIPVSLVEEKIEEYKQRIEKQEKETDVEFYENITNTAIVQVLQELLEKRK